MCKQCETPEKFSWVNAIFTCLFCISKIRPNLIRSCAKISDSSKPSLNRSIPRFRVGQKLIPKIILRKFYENKTNFLTFRYKKNLKTLYLVHPTNFIRVVWNFFKPIISVKFGRKVQYVNYLHELTSSMALEQIPIPKPVIE